MAALNFASCSQLQLNDAFIALLIICVESLVVVPSCVGATEYLDVQSGAALSLMWRCFIRNLDINDRSLRLNSRGFFNALHSIVRENLY